jgi:MFS family permease
VGALADRYGRKTACLAYCAVYALSCTTLLSNNIYVLFLGRILGGVCGTVLWSVFESWLVAEFNQLMLQDSDPILSSIFSAMTTSNTCVAIGAGIFAEWLVRWAGTAKAPFMASIVCLGLSFVAISRYWGENYGSASGKASETEGLLQQEEATPAPAAVSPLRMILRDRNILILALVSGFFEGSLFLFIFFKFPALKLSHKLAGSTDGKHATYPSTNSGLTSTRTAFRTHLRHSDVFHDVWFITLQARINIRGTFVPTKDAYGITRTCFSMLFRSWAFSRRACHAMVLLHLRVVLRYLLPRDGLAEEQARRRWLESEYLWHFAYPAKCVCCACFEHNEGR